MSSVVSDKFAVAEKAAKKACSGAEIGSNIETDLDKPRRRTATRRFTPDRTGSDSEGSPVSKKAKKAKKFPATIDDSDSAEIDSPSPKKTTKKPRRRVQIYSDSDSDAQGVESLLRNDDELDKLVAQQKKEIELKKKALKSKKTSKVSLHGLCFKFCMCSMTLFLTRFYCHLLG